MLHVDPNRRPTAAAILKYSWIANRHRLSQKVLPDSSKDPHSLKVNNIFFRYISSNHDYINSIN